MTQPRRRAADARANEDADPAGRLLIASNRLPVTLANDDGQTRLLTSNGGLATALKSPHERPHSLWFGWPGDLSGLPANHRGSIADELAMLGTVPVELSPAEVTQYYDGFSNGVLWPLLHYLLDKVNLDAERDWACFRAVNEKFAAVIARQYRPGDRIWIHDYQLALVPGLLRAVLPEATIGFFLHVPFPAADVFRLLPWRQEILRGLLGADLVGFHTAGYAANFRDAVAHVLAGPRGDDCDIVHDGRRVQIGAFPIGIDATAFEDAAGGHDVAERVAEIRRAAAGKHIVLGIDRLDYTKGVPRRLLAINRLLEERRDLRDRFHFIQVAVPTRERVDAYVDLRRTVNELVGRINSQHGSATGAPVHLLYRSIGANELVALYRAADVMLVTPLRDGMNLVAKEFVAARTDDRGVLVLSEFAGAAAELTEALLVNPYDIGAVARALATALSMPPDEQRQRMQALRATVSANHVNHWADSYLQALDACVPTRHIDGESAGAEEPTGAASETLQDCLIKARSAAGRTIVLDYDGTLVDFAPSPDLAVPDDELRQLLAALGSLPNTTVHIVSGRDRGSLGQWLGDLPVGLHAEHGFWSRVGGAWIANDSLPTDWQGPIRVVLDAVAAMTPGALVEIKATSLAFHHRMVEPKLAVVRVRELRRMLGPFVASDPIELMTGARVLEVRPRGVHKGLVVARIAAAAAARRDVIVAAGDDLTDEDTFRALPADAITIKVGSGPSLAGFQIGGPHQLRRLLHTLL